MGILSGVLGNVVPQQNMMNFQIQLSKRQGVVPITRDYIGDEEARLRGVERGRRPRLQIAGE